MDNTTWIITVGASSCIVIFGIAAVAASLYGILVWYPHYRQNRVDALKAAGRQGEATIIRLPHHELRPNPMRRAVFTLVKIGLEIHVPGIDTYEVDKVFTIPTHALNELLVGKTVAVWVDPKEPRNLDKIVIHINQG
jgi:hypothetical protein